MKRWIATIACTSACGRIAFDEDRAVDAVDVSLTCGNNAIDIAEVCDDGNRIDGDGCSSSCELETAVPGEGCTSVGELLPVVTGTDRFGAAGAGTTVAAADDETGACTSIGGRDQVYAFTLSGGSFQLTITLEPMGFDGAVYLRGANASSCTDPLGELACADTAGVGAVDQMFASSIPAGRYYVIVDSGMSSTSGGDYLLQLDAKRL